VLSEPLRIARTSTHGKRSPTPPGNHLVSLAQLLDPVGGHPPAGREQAPERDGRGRRVPLDPPSPTLVSVHERRGVAVEDEPSAGPQRAEGAQRDLAAEPVEHDVNALSGELPHPGQEVLMSVIDGDRAEPLDGGTVASRTGSIQANPGQRSEL